MKRHEESRKKASFDREKFQPRNNPLSIIEIAIQLFIKSQIVVPNKTLYVFIF